MRLFVFFILHLFAIAAADVIIGMPVILNYDELPACSRNCVELQVAERGCVPPQAAWSNKATYLACFCQSDHLASLHNSGDICHKWCSSEDALYIYHHYNNLCGTRHPLPTPTTSAPSVTPTNDGNPSHVPTPTSEMHGNTSGQEPSARPKGKYFAIAGALITFILLAILALVFWRRYQRKQEQVRKRSGNNGLIPLQLINTRARSASCLRSERSLRTIEESTASLSNLPNMEPSSSLASPGSVKNFGDCLRFYAADVRDQAEGRDRLAAVITSPAPVRPRLQRHNEVAMRRY